MADKDFLFSGFPRKKGDGLYFFPNPSDVLYINRALENVETAVKEDTGKFHKDQTVFIISDIYKKITQGLVVVTKRGTEHGTWYQEIKKEYGTSQAAWVFTGDLLKNIKSHSLGKDVNGVPVWAAGIVKGVMGGGWKWKKDREIWIYAVSLEKNYAPIFEPAYEEFFDTYRSNADNLLKAIGSKWVRRARGT